MRPITINESIIINEQIRRQFSARAILAGKHGLVEINKRVRADPALQTAFSRKGCAEQSVVQETLDTPTAQNVAQMKQAVDQIYCRHS